MTPGTDSGPDDPTAFDRAIGERNAAAARVAAWLVAVINPFFGILDRFLIGGHDKALLAIRFALEAVAVTVLLLGWRAPTVLRAHVLAIGLGMMLVVSWSIEAMVFLHTGYSSPYYAGICLVTITTGYLFLVKSSVALLYHALVYIPFITPAVLGLVLIEDIPLFVTHQLFLLSTILIVFVSQRFRFRLEEREFHSNLALQRTKASLEQALGSLKKLDELKSQFFNNITHELRTPLTMILAPVETLRQEQVDQLNADQKSLVDSIWKNGIRLLKLINDLLDLARMSERYLKLRVTETTLNQTLTQIVDYSKPLAARKQIDLGLLVLEEPVGLFCDVEKIERAIVNVVSNALKFTEPGGSVKIQLAHDGESARISVTDTGIGIPQDKLRTIFEQFSQADTSTTRRFGGSGIGLAFAERIVTLHGGQIEVQSEVGRGSTFTIVLPLGAEHFDHDVLDRRRRRDPGGAARARRSEDHGPREWAAQLTHLQEYRYLNIDEATDRRRVQRGETRAKLPRLLVVEDNLDVAEFIHMHLRSEFTILVAADGSEGLRLAREKRPDVIVSDYMMPTMDGLELLHEIRSHEATADMPFIMLTAKSQLEDRLQAGEAGADAYLGKPFSPHELETTITRQLKRRGRQVTNLMKANLRSLEVVSAGLAHEINNPLGYIRTASAVIQEGLNQALQQMESVLDQSTDTQQFRAAFQRMNRMSEMIALGIKKIERIVEVMRRYAQEGYSHAPLPIDLDAAVRDVLELVAPRGDTVVHIEPDLQASKAEVVCIAEELHQVLSSLIQNAVDAVEDRGGTVHVRTSRDGQQAILAVDDDGPGIDEEDVARIFTPFYTTKPPGSGMGLGLSIVQRVVADMGGTIDVQTSVGEGTTFRVTLPIHRRDAEVLTTSPSLSAPNAPSA